MRTTPLPSAFTFSMKRSKFLENCVPSANDVTARRVTSCADAGDAASPKRPETTAAKPARRLTLMVPPPLLLNSLEDDSIGSNLMTHHRPDVGLASALRSRPTLQAGTECRAWPACFAGAVRQA